MNQFDTESSAGNENLALRVRTMQIIAAGLVIGVVFFAIIVVAIGGLNQPPVGNTLAMMGAGIAGLMFVAHLVVPGIVAKSAAGQSQGKIDTEQWAGIYQMKLIIGMAMLEGAAFINLVACMTEHNWWSMAVVGGLVLFMLIQFPNRSRVEQWMETQQLISGQE